MAKKKLKKAKKVKKEMAPEAIAVEPESQLDCIERELNDLFKGLSLVNSRIDRIVTAIGKAKSVKGL